LIPSYEVGKQEWTEEAEEDNEGNVGYQNGPASVVMVNSLLIKENIRTLFS